MFTDFYYAITGQKYNYQWQHKNAECQRKMKHAHPDRKLVTIGIYVSVYISLHCFNAPLQCCIVTHHLLHLQLHIDTHNTSNAVTALTCYHILNKWCKQRLILPTGTITTGVVLKKEEGDAWQCYFSFEIHFSFSFYNFFSWIIFIFILYQYYLGQLFSFL